MIPQYINALAYTTGNNIVFNEGQYAPGSDSGNRLLAHELTHVVQQKQGRVNAGSSYAKSAVSDRVYQRQQKNTDGKKPSNNTQTTSTIPDGSIDSKDYDTYFNEDGTVSKTVPHGKGHAYFMGTDKTGNRIEKLLGLTNKEILDRANWVFGESGVQWEPVNTSHGKKFRRHSFYKITKEKYNK